MEGFTPGVAPVKLTTEPLGTEGELTPGPDHLNPNDPEHRRELVDRGYLTTERDEINTVGGVRDPDVPTDPMFDPLGESFEDPPEMPPLLPRF